MKTLFTAFLIISCFHTEPSLALDDLLMTAQQRAQINIIRSKDHSLTEVQQPLVETMKIDGFFFNNNDKSQQGVLWINGKQIKDRGQGESVELKDINQQEKTVSIIIKGASTSTPLKAGQKLMLNDGQIQDAYQR